MLLRFHQYWLDRALWIDEAFVAINLLNRDYGELLLPLDYNQGAPFGFLAIERLSIDLLGNQEWVLRLFPFVSSIVALFLFWRVADYFCGRMGGVASLGLLALCDRAIYYGSELKQYSSDLAIAVLLYACLIPILPAREQLPRSRTESVRLEPTSTQREDWGSYLLFSGVGAIAVWVSHPAVFVIAGTGLWLIGTALWNRQWPRALKYAIAFLAPAISFVSFYVISISKLIDNAALQSSWSEGHDSFAPIPPTSLEDLKWLFAKFFEVFNYPVGISLTGIAALVFAIGCVALWRENRQTWGLLLTPIAVTLFASALNKYPFKGQLLLFLVPIVLAVIGYGVSFLWQWGRPYSSTEFWLSRAMVALLFVYPVYHAALNVNNPNIPPSFEYQRVREDLRPVLTYIQENWQTGDTLYVYYPAQYAFRYYGEQYGFDLTEALPAETTEPYSGQWYKPALVSTPPSSDPAIMIGEYSREDWSIAEQEIAQLDGRVWALFSHAYDRRSDLDEEDVFLHFLDRSGTQLDSFNRLEAAAYLYQF